MGPDTASVGATGAGADACRSPAAFVTAATAAAGFDAATAAAAVSASAAAAPAAAAAGAVAIAAAAIATRVPQPHSTVSSKPFPGDIGFLLCLLLYTAYTYF